PDGKTLQLIVAATDGYKGILEEFDLESGKMVKSTPLPNTGPVRFIPGVPKIARFDIESRQLCLWSMPDLNKLAASTMVTAHQAIWSRAQLLAGWFPRTCAWPRRPALVVESATP